MAERHADYAYVTLGNVRGRLINIDSRRGVMFLWSDGQRIDGIPWEEAVKRFGPPQAN
jgi:hypothetical protein